MTNSRLKSIFRYLPVTGPLSGASFERQTEDAINEVFTQASDAIDISKDVQIVSQKAINRSETALETANNAQTQGSLALQAANDASEMAASALNIANQATADALHSEELANEALSAIAKTEENIQANKESLSILDKALDGFSIQLSNTLNTANNADMLARQNASDIDKIYEYENVNEAVDLYEFTDNGRYYIQNTQSSHMPSPNPLFLDVDVDQDASLARLSALDLTTGLLYTCSASLQTDEDTGFTTAGTFTDWLTVTNRVEKTLETKQDTLTFDAMPTAGSTNPVTSGGVKAAIESAISTVYKWKGSVDAVADLPLEGNELGDVYNVRSSGANYGWTGTEWDNLGGIEAVDAAPVKDSGFPVASGGVFDALATKQDNLVFDSSPTADSANPVTSSGIRAAIDAIPEQVNADWQATEGKALVLNKPTTLAGFGITDAASKAELASGLANKQNTLVFDETPTAGSTNVVTSGAVRAAIDSVFGELDTLLEEILS